MFLPKLNHVWVQAAPNFGTAKLPCHAFRSRTDECSCDVLPVLLHCWRLPVRLLRKKWTIVWNWAVFKIPVDWWVYLFVSVLSNTGNYHNPWEPCVELEPLKRCKGLVSMTDWEWIVMLLNAASKTKASAQWDGSHVWWKRSEMEKHSSWNHLKHLKTLVKDPKRDKQWNIAKDVHRFSPSNSFPFWIATTSSAAVAPVAAAGWMVPALSPIRWLWGYYLTAEAGPGRVDDAGKNHVKTE